MGDPVLREQLPASGGLGFGLSLVLQRSLPLVHAPDDDAHRKAEVVLIFLAEKGKRGAGPQVVGLEPQCEARIDFEVEAATSHQRPTGTDFRFGNAFGGSLAADTLMSVQELAKRRPAFILATGKLRAEKNVVLPRRRVECDTRGTKLAAIRKWRRHGCRDLGGSKVLAALHDEPQPTGRVQGQGSIPTRQPRPVPGVEKAGFGVRTAGKELEARELDRARGIGGSSWSWNRNCLGGGRWGRSLICGGSWSRGLRWSLCPRNHAQRSDANQNSQVFPHDSSLKLISMPSP